MGDMKRAGARYEAEHKLVEAQRLGKACVDCAGHLDTLPWTAGPRRCDRCEDASRSQAIAVGDVLFPVDLVFFRNQPTPGGAFPNGKWLVHFEARSIGKRQSPRYRLDTADDIRGIVERSATRLNSEARNLLEVALNSGKGRVCLQLDGVQMRKLVR